MNSHDFYIYVLFRENGIPFYLGKGRGNRWSAHEWPCMKNTTSRKASIIRNMHSRGFEVIKTKIHENLTEHTAHEYEIALINAIGRDNKGPLVNLTDGGDGVSGLRKTPESVEKTAAAHRGKKNSSEMRDKISTALRGRKFSPETIEKNAAAHRGKKYSPETREKIAKAVRGRIVSSETREKMSAWQRGRKMSPESSIKGWTTRRANINNDTRTSRA